MKNYSELTKAQQKQVQDSTGYTDEQLATEDDIFIPEYEFEQYAQDLAVDIGAINPQMNWPVTCIDWEEAAKELQMDYTTATIDGEDYLMRAF